MLKIYGSPSSSAGRCYWFLHEVQQEFEGVSISFEDKQNLDPDFLKMNPLGKIPVLVDKDFVMSESMAINFYLAEKYKPELLGGSIKTRAQVKQWSFWALADLQTPLVQVFIQKVFVPEARRSDQVIEKNLKKLPRLLETLNHSLEGNTYLVDNKFSVADVNVHTAVIICEAIDYDLSSYANITNWMESLKKRPAYTEFKNYEKNWGQ